MTKRFFGLIIALTLVFAMSVNVNAAYYLNQDFSAGDLSMFDSMNEVADAGRENIDGEIHLFNPTNSAMSQRLFPNVSSITSDTVFQYDLCRNSLDGYLIINLYLGNDVGRFMLNHEGARLVGAPYVAIPNSAEEANVWYTYVWDMNLEFNDAGEFDAAASTMDIYRKRRDSDEAFTFVGTAAAETNKSKAQVQPYCAKGFDGYLDNVKMFGGTFAEGTVFELDGAEVNALSDIKPGELNIKTKIVTSKMEDCTVTPVLVAYNSNNKMIHSTLIDNTELSMGENELEFSIDTSSFADRLEGGYLGFYIWDNLGSLQPLAKAIELK